MAHSVSLTLCVLLVLATGCLGFSGFQPFQSFGPWSTGSGWQGQQRHRPLRSTNECKLDRINALEPTNRIEAEGGTIEYWSSDDQEFQCAGVNAVRHVIKPQGLLLPSFTNSPQLSYIVEGRGVIGAVFPGCPETYQSGSSEGSSQWSHRERERESHRGEREHEHGQRRGQSGKFNDQHQKIRNFRQGDIIALPTGISHWIYNDGQTPIVAVTIFDTSNDANQLDQSVRKFFLAGSSQSQQGIKGRKEMRGRHEGTRGQQIRGHGQGEQSQNWQSIFSGFDKELLSDVYNVNQELISSLQGQNNDERGSIVLVKEPLEFLTPAREEQERRHQGHEGKWIGVNNVFGETFCNARLIQNIADPIQADLFNPRAGRITTLNSEKLPILNYIQLSAERGVLYRNALLAPKYEMNSHNIIYITRGSSRVQMVNEKGQNVFDEQVQEGQLLIVPQNFVLLKQAGNEGCEWVSFKTIDNAMVSPLAGRVSIFRGFPEEVLMNSFRISREDAKSLKYNREELLVFGAGSTQGREYEEE